MRLIQKRLVLRHLRKPRIRETRIYSTWTQVFERIYRDLHVAEAARTKWSGSTAAAECYLPLLPALHSHRRFSNTSSAHTFPVLLLPLPVQRHAKSSRHFYSNTVTALRVFLYLRNAGTEKSGARRRGSSPTPWSRSTQGNAGRTTTSWRPTTRPTTQRAREDQEDQEANNIGGEFGKIRQWSCDSRYVMMPVNGLY